MKRLLFLMVMLVSSTANALPTYSIVIDDPIYNFGTTYEGAVPQSNFLAGSSTTGSYQGRGVADNGYIEARLAHNRRQTPYRNGAELSTVSTTVIDDLVFYMLADPGALGVIDIDITPNYGASYSGNEDFPTSVEVGVGVASSAGTFSESRVFNLPINGSVSDSLSISQTTQAQVPLNEAVSLTLFASASGIFNQPEQPLASIDNYLVVVTNEILADDFMIPAGYGLRSDTMGLDIQVPGEVQPDPPVDEGPVAVSAPGPLALLLLGLASLIYSRKSFGKEK